MAIKLTRDCAFPQDLEAAAFAIEQDLGDLLVQTLALLDPITAAIPSIGSQIDAGNDLLNRIIATGDASTNISSLDALSRQYCLPNDPPSQKNNETQLFYSSVTMVKSVLHVRGDLSPNITDSDNIEVLRRLYLSLNRSLPSAEAALTGNRKVFAHNRLDYKVVPPDSTGKAPSLETIQSDLHLEYLTDQDIYLDPGTQNTLISYYTFIDRDEPLPRSRVAAGVDSDREVLTSMFHYKTVDNSTNAINYYRSLGYSNNELNAIVDGTDLATSDYNPIPNLLAEAKSSANSLIDSIDFVQARYPTLGPESRSSLQTKLSAALADIVTQHHHILSLNEFRVSTIQQNYTLSKLRELHTDEEIIYMLEQRPEVKGVYLDAPDAAIERSIDLAQSTPAGSTQISNNFLENTRISGTSKKLLLEMLYYLNSASNFLLTLNPENLSLARAQLVKYTGLDPIVVVAPDAPILQGQPNTASPTSLIAQEMDPIRTFRISLRIAAVDAALASLSKLYTEDVAKPLARVINIIAKLFESAMRILNQIVNAAKGAVLPLKNRIDAFMSRYLSLVGKGEFDSSLLKCAINFNIGLSTNLFDDLLKLIDTLANSIAGVLAQLVEVLSNMINKILCAPINLMNSFLGGLESNLPSFCALPRVDLGDDLNNALSNLRKSGTLYTNMLSAFSSDLFSYKAQVSTAADTLNRFNASAACNSSNTANFYNSALLNIGGVFGGNPIGSVGSAVGGAIGGVLG